MATAIDLGAQPLLAIHNRNLGEKVDMAIAIWCPRAQFSLLGAFRMLPCSGIPVFGVDLPCLISHRRNTNRRGRTGSDAGARWSACSSRHDSLPSRFFMSHQQGLAAERNTICSELAGLPGNHLVVVRYGRNHNLHEEWVYNPADIDGAQGAWAREMDDEHNRKLIGYFQDRTVWLLEPDVNPAALRPYPR